VAIPQSRESWVSGVSHFPTASAERRARLRFFRVVDELPDLCPFLFAFYHLLFVQPVVDFKLFLGLRLIARADQGLA